MSTAAETVLHRLVSRSELADLAGVSRPTITTWAKRHEDFPRPIRSGEGDFLPLAEAAAWLDRRPIPAAARSAEEPAGYTYGQRVRHSSAHPDATQSPQPKSADDDERRVLNHLLGLLAIRVRGGVGSQADYVTLLLCLIFLRRCAAQSWIELERIAEVGTRVTRPEALINRIGALSDVALRGYGIVPGVQAALGRLRARSIADLAEVLRLCSRLGAHGFGELLDQFAAEARLSSSDFFTPAEVALLMANLVAKDAGTDLPVYDPYSRGGELLRAVRLVRPAYNLTTVRGENPNVETLRFGAMQLALLGQPFELRQGSSTPWEDPEKLRPLASAVVLNPPFNMRAELSHNALGDAWPFGPPPADNANFAWMQYAISCLAPDATAAVLMPRHAGTASDQKQRKIRVDMVEQGTIEAIIMLPSRLFQLSSADVNLWVVRPPTGAPKPILFVDARRMLDRSRSRQILTPAAGELISGLYRRRRSLAEGERIPLAEGGLATMARVAAVRGTGYSLNPLDYIRGRLSNDPLAPSASGLQSLHELRNQLRELDRLGAVIQELRPVARSVGTSAPPSGWSQLPLVEVCNVQPGPSYSRLGIQERTQAGSVPIVMPRHLREHRIVAGDAEKASDNAARRLDGFRLCVNDIVCVRSGKISDPAIVQERQNGWLFGTNIIRLRITRSDLVDARYLLGFLSLPGVSEWIRSQSTSTVVSSISAASMRHLLITLPPLAEQRQIGSALIAFDDLITAHREFALAVKRTRETLSGRLIEGALTLQ
jgi:type I restriction enzyme M protein